MAKKRKTIAHREKARTDKVRESVAGYSPTLAVLYGQFVDSVYQMYEKYPGNPTPPALALPAGYKLIAWVQMMDFIIVGGDWTFYGLIAQSTTDENNFVLAQLEQLGGSFYDFAISDASRIKGLEVLRS